MIENFNIFLLYQTTENFVILQFKLYVFINVNDKKKAQVWLKVFESRSKTTIPKTKRYEIKGKHILFHELKHYIHSNIVKIK